MYKHVKPKKGLIVRDPKNKAMLPPDGMKVPWNGPDSKFWRRRLKDGDIYLADEVPSKVESNDKFKKGGF